MSNEEAQLKELEEKEQEFEKALAIMNDPNASKADKAKAKPIVEAQEKFWADAEARIDEIMDIEDDDEREKAWEAWEAEGNSA